jgi:hypothetical protein
MIKVKRKSMLLNKIIRERKYGRKDFIGLVGAHRGAGVTYTGLMLAFYIGEELGRKTALLECNDNHDMELLHSVLGYGCGNPATFSFGNITVYKQVKPDRLPEVLGNLYECFIMDFGTDYHKYRNEFLRCGTKFILSGQGEWNRQKLLQFIKSTRTIPGREGWIQLLPCAGSKAVNRLKSETGTRCYSVPYEEDPTMPGRETIKLFDSLIY